MTCRCGHSRTTHDHYRAGTDCGACGPARCPAYRTSWRALAGDLRAAGFGLVLLARALIDQGRSNR
jgi:hypothetical protein